MLRIFTIIFLWLVSFLNAASASTLPEGPHDLVVLQQRWAQVKYQITDEEEQKAQIKLLVNDALTAVEKNPKSPELLVWQAIILSTDAGISGGLGALGKVKKARKLLEKAEKLNPGVLNGAVPTSLGSLYYQVPGWPVGFGSNKKARKYLEKAIALNPDGIDSNFFYGEFLYETGKFDQAAKVLEHALEAAPRQHRPIADSGRREEIMVLLAKVNKKRDG